MRHMVCPEGQIDIFPSEVMADLFKHPRPDAPLPPLPFPRNKEIDVPRLTKILATNTTTVLLMLKQKLIRGYKVRSGKAVAWRVEHASVLAYCDELRLKYHLEPRPKGQGSLRIADDKILPFPVSDTITVAEVAEHIEVRPHLVGHMLQEGDLLGYRLVDGAPWRISRKSFRRYLQRLEEQAKPPLSVSVP